MKVKVCECCGQPLPAEGVYKDLTPRQRRMFEVIARSGRAGIMREGIIDYMYADDRNGGPASFNIIAVMHSKMKAKLAKHGLKIVTRQGNGATWRIEKIDVV